MRRRERWSIHAKESGQQITGHADLCLGRTDVLAAVLAVDALEVVGTRPDVVNRAFRDVCARVVVLFAELFKRTGGKKNRAD